MLKLLQFTALIYCMVHYNGMQYTVIKSRYCKSFARDASGQFQNRQIDIIHLVYCECSLDPKNLL
jgi:hypothetical protein